eukprot:364772-Chlamydomonas_euryale.AAC.7
MYAIVSACMRIVPVAGPGLACGPCTARSLASARRAAIVPRAVDNLQHLLLLVMACRLVTQMLAAAWPRPA